MTDLPNAVVAAAPTHAQRTNLFLGLLQNELLDTILDTYWMDYVGPYTLTLEAELSDRIVEGLLSAPCFVTDSFAC